MLKVHFGTVETFKGGTSCSNVYKYNDHSNKSWFGARIAL